MEKIEFTFHKDLPPKSGYYLVKLNPGHINKDHTLDVDYYRKNEKQWSSWYTHNIHSWAEIPKINLK